MISNKKKFLLLPLIGLALISSLAFSFGSMARVVHAQGDNNTNNPRSSAPSQTPSSQPSPSSTSTAISLSKIKNPLGETDTIAEVIKKLMDIVLMLALPFIVLFFIYSGFQFVTARGKPEKLKTAKAMFWHTLLGALLILGAWTVATAIVNTINDIAAS